MSEENAIVYNIEVSGQKRKAFDVVALKQFLETKRRHYSMLNLDPSSIGDTETVQKFIAKAAVDTLTELEDSIDEVLGIKQVVEKPLAEPLEPEVEEGQIDLESDPEPEVITPEEIQKPAPKPKSDPEPLESEVEETEPEPTAFAPDGDKVKTEVPAEVDEEEQIVL